MSAEVKKPAQEYRKNLFSLHEQFSQSEYGQTLAAQVRYERFKPGPVTNEQWEELLGPDVNNLRHLVFTHELTVDFIETQAAGPAPFTQLESEQLELAAMTHDWGESIVGDITFEAKTEEDEADEVIAMTQIARQLTLPHQSPTIEQIIETFSTVVLGGDTSLSRAFNGIERLGYLTTGLRAWQKSKEAEADTRSGLQWLANNVMLNQIPTLLEYAGSYPAIGMYVAGQAGTITEVFEQMPMAIFDRYGTEDLPSRKAKWGQAKAVWSKWK